MYFAEPKSWCSWDFHIYDEEGESMCFLDSRLIREKARFTLGELTYDVYRDGMLSRKFTMEYQGEIYAVAKLTSIWRRRLEIEAGSEAWELIPPLLGRKFTFYCDGKAEGRIEPQAWFTRKATIDLPDRIHPAVQVFLFWLVAVSWKRDQEAAASS